MRTTKRPRLRRGLLLAAAAIAIVAGVLYKLADRYLIEHVEVVVNAPTSPSGADASNAADQEDSIASESSTEAEAAADDWNYKSDDLSIAIKRVVSGSGSDQITYYAADVKISDASLLQSAFAKNKFGRNIVETTSEIASSHQAVFAINGDYYGFRGDGVIIRNGTLYRDEPARDAAAFFKDGTMASYDEEKRSAQSLLDAGVLHTFSFGPVLIENGSLVQNLDKVKIDTNFGNRSISNANPRTGIGMIEPNHYVFVVVDGRQSGSRGMTLDEFAQLFADLGAKEAYNLDGGGSSTMYFMGRVVNNPQGKQTERGVSDILYVGEG